MKLRDILFVACGVTALATIAPRGAVAAENEGAIQVGQKAPQFQLKDQNGVERSLAEMLKTSKVAIVFHRSASW